MKLTKYQTRLLRTEPDEVDTLEQVEAYDLFVLLIEALNNPSNKDFFLPDYADNAGRMATAILMVLDELSGEDAFGTEGWRRGLFGIDD